MTWRRGPKGCPLLTFFGIADVNSSTAVEYKMVGSGMGEVWVWFESVCNRLHYDVDIEATLASITEWAQGDIDPTEWAEIMEDDGLWRFIDNDRGGHDMGLLLSEHVVTTGPKIPYLGSQYNGVHSDGSNEWTYGEVYILDPNKIRKWGVANGIFSPYKALLNR